MLQTELPKSNRSRRRGRFDDELLFEAIAGTTGLSAEFVGVAEEIARRNDRDAALRLFHGFEALIQQSGRPPRAGGVFRVVEFDTTKFLGHELFTSFTAVLMKHQRMELLGEVLNEGLVVDGDEGYATKTFAKLSARVRSLHTYFSRRGQNWISASGALLKERHSGDGELARAMPWRLFMDADYLLFLRAAFDVPADPRVFPSRLDPVVLPLPGGGRRPGVGLESREQAVPLASV